MAIYKIALLGWVVQTIEASSVEEADEKALDNIREVYPDFQFEDYEADTPEDKVEDEYDTDG